MTLRTDFGTYEVDLIVSRYMADNSVAIMAYSREREPIATLTVCLDDKRLTEDETHIDTNNCPWAVDFIEQEKLGKKTDRIGHSGFCTYPVIKLDMDRLRE